MSDWSYRKNIWLTQTWRCDAKFHDPSKRKISLSRADLALSITGFWMVWRCCVILDAEDAVFKINGKKRHLEESDFHHCYGNYSILFWKLLDHSYGIIHLLSSQNFPKTNISYPLIRTRRCVYQGVRNVRFSENFASVINEWSLYLKFILRDYEAYGKQHFERHLTVEHFTNMDQYAC